jgi:cytochrome b
MELKRAPDLRGEMDKHWDIKTRQLHWGIAVTVTFQQFSSLYMSDPGPQYLFPYHRILGAVSAADKVFAAIFGLGKNLTRFCR